MYLLPFLLLYTDFEFSHIFFRFCQNRKVYVMDSELFNFLTTQGIFALLFGYLLLYILKQNQIREENYQKIIQQLNEVLPTIKNDLEDIKKQILKN